MTAQFNAAQRETIMVLATIRAIAASCAPTVRLIGNLRCDDLVRSIDELMPLDEDMPGKTLNIDVFTINPNRIVQDGAPSVQILTNLMNCALRWEGDATIIGPLQADEVASAVFFTLGGKVPQGFNPVSTPNDIPAPDDNKASIAP